MFFFSFFYLILSNFVFYFNMFIVCDELFVHLSHWTPLSNPRKAHIIAQETNRISSQLPRQLTTRPTRLSVRYSLSLPSTPPKRIPSIAHKQKVRPFQGGKECNLVSEGENGCGGWWCCGVASIVGELLFCFSIDDPLKNGLDGKAWCAWLLLIFRLQPSSFPSLPWWAFILSIMVQWLTDWPTGWLTGCLLMPEAVIQPTTGVCLDRWMAVLW